ADFGKKDGDAFGIPGANLDDFTSGIPSINIAGFSNPIVGYSASVPWDRGETIIDVVNNWTKIRGNHTFKWGADIRRLRDDLVQAQTFSPRGLFRFGQDATVAGTTQRNGDSKTNQLANDFAAFLIDMPSNGTAVAVGRDISVISGSWRETQTFFYGQDSWKLTPKLTVDAGLRWEVYFPATA